MGNFKLIIAMFVLAIFAVGAVSATEDIAIDDNIIEPAADVAVEDVAVDEIDESASDVETDDVAADVNDEDQGTRTTYDVDETTTDIQAVINSHEAGNHVVSFKPINYTINNALTIHGNVNLIGNGATLIGGSDNIFAIDNATNFTVTGFNIVTPNKKAAFYGANVNDSKIINNNITGGKDGINIKQQYRNLTISGNTITGVSRDAISLVNHDSFDNDDWQDWVGATVSNNIITGSSEYGMFFGGNFKGFIEDNTIDGVDCGIQFAGKGTPTNGKLDAEITANNITNVQMGIDMCHPYIDYLYISWNNIETLDVNSCFAIHIDGNFSSVFYQDIYVYSNYLYGMINQTFINKTVAFLYNYGYIIV